MRFASGPAGTYHYWASVFGAPVPFRELAGAIVVDDPSRPVDPDRILVITEWSNLTPQQLGTIMTADDATEAFVAARSRYTFVINGLSWPATERLTYRARRACEMARHQPQLAGPSAALARVLLRRGQPGRRPARHGVRCSASPPRRHAAPAVRRDAVDDVDARARRATGCSTATSCITCRPSGGWAMPRLRPITRRVITAVRTPRQTRRSAWPAWCLASRSANRARQATAHAPTRRPAARKLTLAIEKAPGEIGELPAAGFVLSEGSAASASGASGRTRTGHRAAARSAGRDHAS